MCIRSKISSCLKLLLPVAITCCISGLPASILAQPKEKIALVHGAHREGRRTDADMARWRSYRLGQFIHWGLYSILGGDFNGKHYEGAAEWIRAWKELPNEAYDTLYKQFNPTGFNPDAWAAMAKQMGVKYLTFTTKHHDGFCLWPSKYTNYTIASTPYKNDIVGAIVNAYTKVGIDVYLYFSVMDWHHPDWRYDLRSKEDSMAFDRFKVFTQNQLNELLHNYPQVKGLWFDGTWDNSWKKSGAFSDSLEQYLKSIRPGLVIGSRLRADEKGARGFDSNGMLMGDYEQGWERKLPKSLADVHGNDWECVMTIPENGWGYGKTWMGHWKTTHEILEMLAQTVSLDGNFVLNFGPKADGSFRPEEDKSAKEIGQWMNKNSEAIYNNGYAAWEKQDWGYYTKKAGSDTVNMIVFNLPVSHILRIKPDNKTKIESAYLLNNAGNKLKLEKTDYGASLLHLPKDFNPGEPFVVVLITSNSTESKRETEAKT